ncbi:hypothetical protein Pla22_18120 [Rubripirellula amarantea]|uniref:Exostosin family protein n=2 Tax=Rubripirellula amarantea TaxID=2527999 RepID=A0A5C5WTZ9_9BACT|nr:hypothetical protein Pla22_18120 [Rubripirellula amarantea]
MLDARDADSTESLTSRPVVLDLQTRDFVVDGARHLAAIAMNANLLGSPCWLRCSDGILATISRKTHGREMLMLRGVTHLRPSQRIPDTSLVLSDVEPGDAHAIWMRLGCDIELDYPVMPYPMLPATIGQYPPSNLAGLRANRDRIRLLFAGNQKPSYGQGKIGRQFNICDRIEVLAAIRESFESRIVSSLAGADQNSIALLDSRESCIEASDWLPTLSTANFFLCCPGSSQPTCHHLVEAMSVGTIPLLEYGDRVTPQLVDGETAITFRGAKGLVEAVERITEMSADDIATMSQNVTRFFDHHLCQRRFLKGLRDGVIAATEQRISLPFHHENLYASSQLAPLAARQAA